MGFKAGEVVRLRVKGTLSVGDVTLTDNVLEGIRIVQPNDDGTYQVDLSFIENTADMMSVQVPEAWLEAM